MNKRMIKILITITTIVMLIFTIDNFVCAAVSGSKLVEQFNGSSEYNGERSNYDNRCNRNGFISC